MGTGLVGDRRGMGHRTGLFDPKERGVSLGRTDRAGLPAWNDLQALRNDSVLVGRGRGGGRPCPAVIGPWRSSRFRSGGA